MLSLLACTPAPPFDSAPDTAAPGLVDSAAPGDTALPADTAELAILSCADFGTAACLVVDGSRATGPDSFATVNEALAAATGAEDRVVILIRRGTYRETLSIAQPRLTLAGEVEGDASAVRIVYDNANPKDKGDGTTYGTAGSATVVVTGTGFKGKNFTIENDWVEGSDDPENPSANQAALALWALGEDLVLDNVALLGDQDTLCADGNGSLDTLPTRQYYRRCTVVGDVDFIFGRATAVFDRCSIEASGTRLGGSPSYITAASTDQNTLGYLFVDSEFSGDGSFYLGRPWNSAVPGSAVNAQVTVRGSTLGAHVLAEGWADWANQGGVDLLAANMRYLEYDNDGPGAVSTSTGARRVLSGDEASAYEIDDYLDDGTGWYDVDRKGFWAE